MLHSLYIAGAEPGSGKSIVVLGMMENLTATVERVGFFRPIIPRDGVHDPLLHLVSSRYELPAGAEALYGCTEDVARHYLTHGDYDGLLKLILHKYKALEECCNLVVCAGTDYSRVTSALELDFNADLANNFGCLLLPVIKGFERNGEEIADAVQVLEETLVDRGCELLATVVNRVDPSRIETVCGHLKQTLKSEIPCFLLPEHPSLEKPTVGEIARTLDARVLTGDADALNHEVLAYKVAAMEVPDFLDYVEEGSLIITPGDRSDIILGSITADVSSNYPKIAGLLLSGGQVPAPQVQRLLGGLNHNAIALLSVTTDTFTTALNVSAVEGTILPGDNRKIAAALGIFEKNVDLGVLQQRISADHARRVTPLVFEYELIQRARAQRMHIVLPEGTDERVLRAAEILQLRGVCELTLLGDPGRIGQRVATLGLKLEGVNIVDPQTSDRRPAYAQAYYELRRHKGISKELAFDTLADVSYFGTLMVAHGDADGMVSGAAHTTQHTIRPAFEVIRTVPGTSLVSSVFFMCLEDRVLVYGDCAVNPNPNAEQLADIAVSSANTAAMFGIEPRVAMLSYSTGESGKGADVEKVREAVAIAHSRRPDLMLEGPIQYDAAVDAGVARSKLPDSRVAGHATVFVFPDLNTGNNTYKAVQRSAGAVAIGPVLQGLNKPVNDLSRGCTVTDIVNTVAITCIQAQASGGAR